MLLSAATNGMRITIVACLAIARNSLPFAGAGPRHARGCLHQGRIAGSQLHVLGDRLRESRPLAAELPARNQRLGAKRSKPMKKSKASEPPARRLVFGRRYDISSIVGGQRYFSVIRMSANEYRRRLQRDRYQHHPLGYPGERAHHHGAVLQGDRGRRTDHDGTARCGHERLDGKNRRGQGRRRWSKPCGRR